mgnify:CR=1 FL=1
MIGIMFISCFGPIRNRNSANLLMRIKRKQPIDKKEYPEIRQKLWKEMFWSQSFCLLSAGGAPIEVIRQYIETQGEKKSEHRVPFSDLPE